MRRRLDVEMVRRGIARTRSEAQLAIREGKVAVAGRPAAKAATMVLDEEPITMARPARRYVSRGGDKLEAALDRFGVDVRDRRALDAGASTGGFTDCLLSRGAAHVIAVDVGYGQLDWRLRQDERVTAFERTNVRDLRPDMLAYRPDLVTADLSFLPLELAIPPLVACAAPGARFVLLVKPQFEADRGEVGSGGVVRDPAVWRRVLERLSAAGLEAGLRMEGLMASPLTGPAGNVEFLLLAAKPPPEGPGSLDAAALDRAMEEAVEVSGRPPGALGREVGDG